MKNLFLNSAREEFTHYKSMFKPFVFLGGTCADSNWRDELIKYLTCSYFNPIIPDWTENNTVVEEDAKKNASVLLYVITPKHYGHYSLVELAVSACMETSKKVIVCFLDEDEGEKFDEKQKSSIEAVKKLLQSSTGVTICNSLHECAFFINNEIS